MFGLADATEAGRNTEARYNIARTEVLRHGCEYGAQKVRQVRWVAGPVMGEGNAQGAMFNARIETEIAASRSTSPNSPP